MTFVRLTGVRPTKDEYMFHFNEGGTNRDIIARISKDIHVVIRSNYVKHFHRQPTIDELNKYSQIFNDTETTLTEISDMIKKESEIRKELLAYKKVASLFIDVYIEVFNKKPSDREIAMYVDKYPNTTSVTKKDIILFSRYYQHIVSQDRLMSAI